MSLPMRKSVASSTGGRKKIVGECALNPDECWSSQCGTVVGHSVLSSLFFIGEGGCGVFFFSYNFRK